MDLSVLRKAAFRVIARLGYLSTLEILAISTACKELRTQLWDDSHLWTVLARRAGLKSVSDEENMRSKNHRDILVAWAGFSLEAKLAQVRELSRRLERVALEVTDQDTLKRDVAKFGDALLEMQSTREGPHPISGANNNVETGFGRALSETLKRCVRRRKEIGRDEIVQVRVLRPRGIVYLLAFLRRNDPFDSAARDKRLWFRGLENRSGSYLVKGASQSWRNRFVGRLVSLLDDLFAGTAWERKGDRRSPWLADWNFDLLSSAKHGAWDDLVLREGVSPGDAFHLIQLSLFPAADMRDHVRRFGKGPPIPAEPLWSRKVPSHRDRARLCSAHKKWKRERWA